MLFLNLAINTEPAELSSRVPTDEHTQCSTNREKLFAHTSACETQNRVCIARGAQPTSAERIK